MKTELIRKVILVGSALLVGITVCVSVWFFLREHRARALLTREYLSREQQSLFPTNNGLTTENRKAMQSTPNPVEEPLDRYEKVARGAKSDFMSLLNEENLADPSVQKLLEVMDSPAYHVFLQDISGASTREWLEFLDSQGVPVPWNALAKDFRLQFPTEEPEDYEPEIRLKIAKLFLGAKPVDLTNPREAALQRQKVFDEFSEDRRNFAWLHGQFDWEWTGAIHTARPGIESNPAFVWMTDIQQNAASIVAAAETVGVPATEASDSASVWTLPDTADSRLDMAPSNETKVPTTLDTSELATMTDTEIEAAIEKSLTPQSPDILTNERPNTPGEIQSNLETTLREEFSSERFERAISTLKRHGPEEGLRRLRENDPEVAERVERHRHGERKETSK